METVRLGINNADVELIRKSEFFDAGWYLEQYPEVKKLNMDPARHYLWIGARLKRKPSPRFDTAAYLTANSDVAESGVNALLHYEKWGKSEGRPLPSPPSTGERTDGSGIDFTGTKAPGNKTSASLPPKKTTTKKSKNSERIAEQYSVISKEFDHAYYLRCYLDIAKARLDPVKHYMEHGAREGRDPSPEFQTKHYLKRYPDVAESGINPFFHYLTIGRAEGRGAIPFSAGEPGFDALCEVIGAAPVDVAQALAARRCDLRVRLESGILGEMVSRAGELEPLIHQTWLEAMRVKIPPFHSEPIVAQVVAMHRLHNAAEHRTADAVVVIPHCRLSGATRIAGYLATALAEVYSPENIVIVRTDLDVMQFPKWFPDDCRHVDFAGICKDLKPREQQRVLVEFLRSLRPAAAFNVNSRIFWDMMDPYGKALADSVALYAYFFCNDKSIHGHWVGYPLQKFYRHFDTCRAMITDNHFLTESLRKQFQVPPTQNTKLVTFETPIASAPQLAPTPVRSERGRAQIFWAGRFDRQKRVDIVFALAERLPELDFNLWGEPLLDNDFKKLKKPNNVVLRQVFTDISELPLDRCDLWLYTSEWDGVPNILIEVAAMGIPLVGSLAGGTGEILLEGLAGRVADIEDVDAFEEAINEALSDTVQARERALRLREWVLARRTPLAYRKALKNILP